ncbi:DNA polymerase III subunit chi [Pseudoroseicyclus aestuarii]|uniref:DNA polymerase III chi subunit n=1 Tax=Pseudoroseicyclus aestuarii TaxID=1795041 RepID=A0A318SNW5_9RHOB|nr:DNA polymerase III chi subunit [Pseudoroseicyclus aestuarii]
MPALFYHLTEGRVEDVLAQLLPRAAQAGWRVELRGTDTAAQERLDLALWQGAPDSFLPHALAGGAQDAAQPVLLTVPGQAATNDPACLFCVGGAEAAPEEAQKLERVCILFDGYDEAALQAARGQWRRLTGAGVAAQYWAQDEGRWVKKQG